ncbi:MAG: septum formation initiator family protein [Pyrinomonadaceae bacterium]
MRRRRPIAPAASAVRRRVIPRWVPVAASVTLVLMITVTVNLRSYFDLRTEEQHNKELNQRVQEITEENLGLQEEIYYLKNDPSTIEREAKKYGLVRPQTNSSRAGEIENAEESINRRTPTTK